MKTASEQAARAIRAYNAMTDNDMLDTVGELHECLTEHLRQWGEEIRESCAQKVEQTTSVMTRKAFQIAEDIRSIQIK